MPDKWVRIKSSDERDSQSFDESLRLKKVIAYGWDGANAVVLKVDSNGVLDVSPSAASTEVGTGTKTVTSAGTRVQFDSRTCKRVFIQARDDNSGVLVIGGSGVVAVQATRQGIALFPSQGEWFNISNMNLLYIDSTSSGDKATFIYEN